MEHKNYQTRPRSFEEETTSTMTMVTVNAFRWQEKGRYNQLEGR